MGRPRHDACGNLRCDYISAILNELRTGQWTSWYKTVLKARFWKGGGCDDHTPLGYDLTWPELPKHVAGLGMIFQDWGDGNVTEFDGLESGDELGSEFDSDETEVEEDHVEDGNGEDGNETEVEDRHAEDSHVKDSHVEDGDETEVEDRDVMDIDE